MSNKCFAFIVLACLVAEASCGLLDRLSLNRKPEAGMVALNEYLKKNAPSAEVAANLDHIRANIGNLKEQPLRRAAELVVAVSEMDKQCKLEDLPVLVELANTNVNMNGDARLNRVLRGAGLMDTVDKCTLKLRDMLPEMVRGKELGVFVTLLRPSEITVNGKFTIKKTDHDWVMYRLFELTRNSGGKTFVSKKQDNGKVSIVKDAESYDNAIETFLLKPCRELLSDPRLDVLIDGVPAMGRLGTSLPWFYSLQRDVEQMAWRKDTCKEFLDMDAAARAKVFRKWKPEITAIY